MGDRRYKRRLAAIVSADVAGYARLMSRDEDGAMDALKAIHGELIEPLANARDGRIVKTIGDGWLLEFASAVEAVTFSIELQNRMAEHFAGSEQKVALRIGVNVGEVISEGTDIFGDGVNIAARLESIADPGGVCLSDDVLRHVSGRLNISVENMGERALKHIDHPVRAHRLRSGSGKAANAPKDAAEVLSLPRTLDRPTLAILPFRSFSADPSAAFVADGVGLGLQTLLVQLSNLFFVNACMHQGYRDGRQTAAEALAGTHVRYAIEGAVQQAGDRARAQVQLSDVDSGAILWAENYDRELRDIFSLQDEIARRIVSALSIELIGGPVAPQFTDSLDHPEAWEHFLRGINLFYNRNKANCTAALKHFEALSQACPRSAVGANYVSTLLYIIAMEGWSNAPAETFAEAARWAERATSIEEGHNGLAYAVLGALALSERRHDDSLRLCREAVAFRSSCPFALERYGVTRTFSGDPDGGVKYLREALSVRMARVPSVVNMLAMSYRDRGDISLSIPAALESERLAPGFIDALATLCTDHALNGDAEEASAVANRLTAEAPGFSAATYAQGLPYRDRANAERVERALIAAGAPQ